MNDHDKMRFKQIFTGVGETYNKEITKTLLSVYFEALKNYSIDQVADALSKHLINPDNGQFFPKPADLVRILTPIERSTEDSAIIAWQLIERAIASVGAYGVLRLDDKIALAAVKSMGSWVQLCHTDREKMAFKRQEFIANYKSMANYPPDQLPSELLGIEAATNNKLGYDKSPIDFKKLIKDAK